MVSISMRARDSIPIVMMLHLATLQAAEAYMYNQSAQNKHILTDSEQKGSAQDRIPAWEVSSEYAEIM